MPTLKPIQLEQTDNSLPELAEGFFEFIPDPDDVNFAQRCPFGMGERVLVLGTRPYEGRLTGEVLSYELYGDKIPWYHRYRGLEWFGLCPQIWTVWVKLQQGGLIRGYCPSRLERLQAASK